MEQHSTSSASKALPSCHFILLEMNHRPQSTLVLFIGTKSNTQGLSITGNIMLRPPSNPFEHLTRSVVRSWPSVSFMRRSKNSICFFRWKWYRENEERARKSGKGFRLGFSLTQSEGWWRRRLVKIVIDCCVVRWNLGKLWWNPQATIVYERSPMYVFSSVPVSLSHWLSPLEVWPLYKPQNSSWDP